MHIRTYSGNLRNSSGEGASKGAERIFRRVQAIKYERNIEGPYFRLESRPRWGSSLPNETLGVHPDIEGRAN